MNKIVFEYQPKRRIHHIRILLLHLLAVSTYFFIIYRLNYKPLNVDQMKIEDEGNFFRLLTSGWINFKSTIDSLFITFKSSSYNNLLLRILTWNMLYTLTFIYIHILIFRIMPKWFIENEMFIYTLYFICVLSHNTLTPAFFNFISVFFLSFFVHIIGHINIDLYSEMLTEYSKVFFVNMFFFVLLIIWSCGYVGLAIYLYIFKTSNCDIAIINILLFLILLWIIDWTIALIEVYTASVTMFYCINRHSDSKVVIVKEVFENTYFCLGSISIGKLYFYFQHTWIFISEVVSSDGFKLSTIIRILIGLPLALLSDLQAFLFNPLKEYVLPYIAIYNITYTRAVQKVYYLLYNQSLLRLFDNIFIKIIFLLIYVVIFPHLKYIKTTSPLKDNSIENVESFKIVFFSITMTYVLFNIFYKIIYTINTTINFSIVLFPILLPF